MLLLLVTTASGAAATKSVSHTISESATITGGNSVIVYAAGRQVVTVVKDGENAAAAPLYGAYPLLLVSFPLEKSWHLVKHVTWDKARDQLTIDF
jgi:hypothetical protein